MPKRKRPSPSRSLSDNDVASSSAVARQRKLCVHRIDTATKALIPLLRLGAGLERQKYSRRKKTAKTNNDEKAIARLDAEYKVLKELDFAKVAEGHLRKTILRVKSLQASGELPATWREAGETEKQTTESLNVTARLFKVKGVRDAVDGCIEDLKGILGLSVKATTTGKRKEPGVKDEEARKKAKKAQKAESEDEDQGDRDAQEEQLLRAFSARIAAPSSGEESEASLTEGERPPSVEDSEEEDGDDDDNGWEEFEEESDAEVTENHDMAMTSHSDTASSSEAMDASDIDESDKPVARESKRKTEQAEKITGDTIIPALSMAGYYSGTESEASDLDDIAPKKNRRGQRARQKIWEQKYGEKAQHLKKQERNNGWDAKRGAVDSSRGGRGRDRKPTGRGPQTSGENAMPLGQRKPKRDDAGALHPSWAAAKAAKEKKVDVKPMGKKITFE